MQGWQGAAATKAIRGEHRWDVGSAGVDAEVDWNVKVTEKDGHVDELPVQLSWNGQVEVERDFDETEDVPEGEWSSVTRDLGKTAYRSEASFGALLEGTPVEDGVVCEGPGRMRSTADERRWVGVATTSVWDQGDVSFVKVGTVDAGCFGMVVTVIPCQTFPESYEELTEWATVSCVSYEMKTVVCRDYRAATGRCSALVSRCELEKRSSKDGWIPVEAVPVIERWCGVPLERDKLARVW
ncbi:hypothetical protein PR003_g22311 [Phytophthora rubi]|uniref:Uncharacterized protein n=1 Tax=Phytophthora rubi TaxID=129364 RepID=A0A6A3J3P3_9STRA|nr:hypothetical protein PR002_g21620 [Phytophthora rubi]KAE8991723.1 hypothetical protein PR001_g21144 [Phytophthora rubi]KAE9302269.1 hypothetical protein PR003_g22311 [Phytophthora rubi]